MFKLDTDKVLFKNRISSGGFGSVYPYKTRDDENGLKTVVKHIKGTSVSVLIKNFSEAVIGFHCRHPSIVPITGYCVKHKHATDSQQSDKSQGPEEFELFLRMPRMKGNLFEYMKRIRDNSRAVPLSQIVKKFYSLASGLDYLHKKEIVHRDIKPHNILLDEKDNVLLSDVGSAMYISEDENSNMITNIEGTKYYMAPELFNNTNKKKNKKKKIKERNWVSID